MASSNPSILSSNPNLIVANHPAPGGRHAHRETLDHGAGILDQPSGLRPVPAEAHFRVDGFGDGVFQALHPGSQSSLRWPIDIDLDLAALPTLSRGYELGKRLFDIALAILIFPVVGPLVALIGAAIALSSGNPVFFRHRRVGRHGREFRIWKFRTMHVDSERHLAEYLKHNPAAREEWRLTHKLQDDPRVSRLGRLLRQTSLDELPQIFNILAGNMSFVGPRPVTCAETAKYAESLPYYLSALPGITGLWQVSGRCSLSYDARVALDEAYVRHWSIARDLFILLKTPRAVFCRHGAY